MKYLDEYRDPAAVRKISDKILRITTRKWNIMEVCGGQTHSIVRYGLDELLPEKIKLIHGPGCPVCVTPLELIDKAIAIAKEPKTMLCSFGDMLRVPGSKEDLLSVKAAGGHVKAVYSPLDALSYAKEHPDTEVVFFAVGFETTAPATAMAVYQAYKAGIKNFSLLVAHVLVPPAINALLDAQDAKIDGFLAAGHVCAVMGWEEYESIATHYKVPIVVTGFEPLDILHGILICIEQLESGKATVANQYKRAVQRNGNQKAIEIINKVFKASDRKWRGIGAIPQSGLSFSKDFKVFDAALRFKIEDTEVPEPPVCISGNILKGICEPYDCKAFATSCTPERPLGAPMVSSEGVCAAYYRYRKSKTE